MTIFRNFNKLWLYALLCLALSGFQLYDFYVNHYSEHKQKTESLSQEIALKKNQLARILAQNQRKGALEAEIKKATEEFEQLQEMFPDSDFLPKKLQDFTEACRKAGVIPVQFKPSHVSEKDFYIENFYEIKINTGYHGLGRFLAEIANLKYPTAITGVEVAQNSKALAPKDTLNSPDDDSHTTTTSFLFKTFTSKQ